MIDHDRTDQIRARLEADRNWLLDIARTCRCPEGCECGEDARVATKLSAAVPDLLADIAHLLAENEALRADRATLDGKLTRACMEIGQLREQQHEWGEQWGSVRESLRERDALKAQVQAVRELIAMRDAKNRGRLSMDYVIIHQLRAALGEDE